MKCPEVGPLVPRFLDGELSGHQMRAVALHITRCGDCESELRVLENLQDLVAQEVGREVEGIDTSGIWSAVSEQIGDAPVPWTDRLRAWWDEVEIVTPMLGWQAAAAATALAIGVLVLPQGDQGGFNQQATAPGSGVEIAQRVAIVAQEESLMRQALESVDNSAEFESIVGDVDQFLVDPETHMAVLWVDDGVSP